MGTVPDWVTITLGFSAADTTVVGSRELRIYDKNRRDNEPTIAALVEVTLANSVNRYEYDSETDRLLEIELWDVASAGGAVSNRAVMVIPVAAAATFAVPPLPEMWVVMIEDVSGESSQSASMSGSSSTSSASASSSSVLFSSSSSVAFSSSSSSSSPSSESTSSVSVSFSSSSTSSSSTSSGSSSSSSSSSSVAFSSSSSSSSQSKVAW